jgi:hypothetical protein
LEALKDNSWDLYCVLGSQEATQALEFKGVKMAQRFPDHLEGTRCFSSSHQLTTMLIFRGAIAAGLAVDAASFIIRNRLPSGLIYRHFYSEGQEEI